VDFGVSKDLMRHPETRKPFPLTPDNLSLPNPAKYCPGDQRDRDETEKHLHLGTARRREPSTHRLTSQGSNPARTRAARREKTLRIIFNVLGINPCFRGGPAPRKPHTSSAGKTEAGCTQRISFLQPSKERGCPCQPSRAGPAAGL